MTKDMFNVLKTTPLPPDTWHLEPTFIAESIQESLASSRNYTDTFFPMLPSSWDLCSLLKKKKCRLIPFLPAWLLWSVWSTRSFRVLCPTNGTLKRRPQTISLGFLASGKVFKELWSKLQTLQVDVLNWLMWSQMSNLSELRCKPLRATMLLSIIQLLLYI